MAPAIAEALLDRQQGAWADQEDFERLAPSFPELNIVEVRDLPPLERLVVLGVFWGNLPLPEVARILQRDTRTVQTSLTKALARLRVRLQGRVVERSIADGVEP